MKLFKKVIAVVALATLSMTMVACGDAPSNTTKTEEKTDGKTEEKTDEKKDDAVIATVQDVTIYKSDLVAQLAQMEQYMQMYYGQDYRENPDAMQQLYDTRDSMVDSIINSEVVALKAKEDKDIKVEAKEVDAELEVTKSQFPSEEDFNKALKEEQLTLDELKTNIEKSLYVQKLIEKYAAKVTISDEDIKNYYEQNKAQYTKQAGANVYHILVDTEDKAKEILDKYNKGTSFEDLAKEFGTDGTAQQGGALGYIPYESSDYDADFMKATKLVEEGKVSNPVKTQFGWHLIKVDGIQKEDKVTSLDEVKDSIKKTLAAEEAQKQITDQIPTWKKEYKIEVFEDVIKADDVNIEELRKKAEEASKESTDSSEESKDADKESTDSSKESKDADKESTDSSEEPVASTENNTSDSAN